MTTSQSFSPNAVRRLVACSIGIFSVGAVAACGSESANTGDSTAAAAAIATATGATRSACEVLSASEVTGIIGQPVRDSLALDIAGGAGEPTVSQCHYATAANPVEAALMVRRRATGESVAQGSQSVRETLTGTGVTAQDVLGIGDVAFWTGDKLHVFTATWYLIVTPTGAGGVPQARALAEKALANLN